MEIVQRTEKTSSPWKARRKQGGQHRGESFRETGWRVKFFLEGRREK